MSKTLRTAALVVGAVALVATGVGAIAGAAAVTATIGVSAATLTAVAGGLSAASALTAKKPSAGSATGSPTDFTADPQAFLPYAIGRTGTAGQIVFRRGFDSADKGENDRQAFAVVLSAAGPILSFERFEVDRAVVTFGAGGEAVGAYAGFMWQGQQNGGGPANNAPGFGGGTPPGWTAAHKATGYALATWTLRFDTKAKFFQNGVPTPMWVIKGVLAYDPRYDDTYPGGAGYCRANDETTWIYSENPYIHALTWIIGRHQNGKRILGLGAPIEAIDVAAYIEGANVADANGWKVGGVVYSGDGKWATLKKILQAGMGEPLALGARISCLVNAPKVSLATITVDDVVGEASVTATQPRRDRINTITPRYRLEENNWQLLPGTPISVAAHVAEDGGQRSREQDYPLIQNTDQVATAVRYDIENAREFGPIVLPLKTVWIGYKPGDCVTAVLPELGLNGQQILFLNRDFDPSTGVPTITARSETAAKHAFALGQTTTPPPTPGVTGPMLVPVPADGAWAITGTEVRVGETTQPAIVIAGATDSPVAEAVVFEYRRVTDGQGADAGWLGAGEEPPTVTGKTITGIRPGSAYEAAVSYRRRGTVGDRCVLGPVNVGNLELDFDYVTGDTRPEDNATNSADPASGFGAQSTVGEQLARVFDLGTEQVELAIEQTTLAVEQARQDVAFSKGIADAAVEAARSTAGIARQDVALMRGVVAQLRVLAKQAADGARADARLYVDNLPIGVAHRREVSERREEGRLIVETIDQVSVRVEEVDHTAQASVTRVERLVITASEVSATSFELVDAQFRTVDKAVEAEVLARKTAVAGEAGARAEALQLVDAKFVTVEAEVDAQVLRIDRSVADLNGATAEALQLVDAKFVTVDAEVDAQVLRIDRSVADLNGATAQSFQLVEASFVTAKANVDAQVFRIDTSVANETEARAEAFRLVGAEFQTTNAAIQAEVLTRETAVSNIYGATAEALRSVAAQFVQADDRVDAEVLRLDRSVASEGEAWAEALLVVSAKVEKADTKIDAEVIQRETAVATLNGATAEAFRSVAAQFKDAVDLVDAQIVRLDKAVVDGDKASAEALLVVTARVEKAEEVSSAEIIERRSTVAELGRATAEALDSVGVQLKNGQDQISAEIRDRRQAIIDEEGARAEDIREVMVELNGAKGSVTELRRVTVSPEGAVEALAMFRVKANGRVAGWTATNDGRTGKLDMEFDDYTFRRPNGTILFRNVGDTLYLDRVVVNTLLTNTAMIASRVSSTIPFQGKWPSSASATTDDSQKDTIASAGIYTSKPGWIEVDFGGKQSFSQTDTAWELVLQHNGGGALESSRVGGRAPQDGTSTKGWMYASVPGFYGFNVRWQGTVGVTWLGRTLFVKCFPDTE